MNNLQEAKYQLAENLITNENLLSIGIPENLIESFTLGTVWLHRYDYDKTFSIYRIDRFEEKQKNHNGHEYSYTSVYYTKYSDIENLDDFENSSSSLSDFKNYHVKNATFFSSIEKAKEWYNSQTIESISNEIVKQASKHEDVKTEGTLVDMSSTLYYGQSIKSIELSKSKMDDLMLLREVKLASLKRTMEIEERKLNIIIRNMTSKLFTLQSVMQTIDAYITAKDKFKQFSEGEYSESKTITLYKSVLYMDEEVGIPGQESINFENVETFFEWLTANGNYKSILNEKSATIFKIRRRKDYHYSDNPFVNGMMNANNSNTYIILRNGDNLWYYDTEESYDEMYPSQDYMLNVNEKIEKINSSSYTELEKETEIEKIKHNMLYQQKKLLVIESIISNTNMLGNEKTSDGKAVSLLNPLSIDEGFVNYQDTVNIMINSENRPLLNDFVKQTSKYVKRGTRILWNNDSAGKRYDYKTRIADKFYRTQEYISPTLGEMYHLHELSESDKNDFDNSTMCNDCIGYIKILPEFHCSSKIRLKFYVYETDNFINYDAMTIADIDYYLMDRHTRRNYMKDMQVIYNIRKELIPEKKMESEFIEYLSEWMLKEHGYRPSEAAVIMTIKWWKEKVIYTRPLSKDDEKAWRMISKKIIRISKKLKKNK